MIEWIKISRYPFIKSVEHDFLYTRRRPIEYQFILVSDFGYDLKTPLVAYGIDLSDKYFTAQWSLSRFEEYVLQVKNQFEKLCQRTFEKTEVKDDEKGKYQSIVPSSLFETMIRGEYFRYWDKAFCTGGNKCAYEDFLHLRFRILESEPKRRDQYLSLVSKYGYQRFYPFSVNLPTNEPVEQFGLLNHIAHGFNCRIDPTSVVRVGSVLGDNVVVGKFCYLGYGTVVKSDSIIPDGTRIPDGGKYPE